MVNVSSKASLIGPGSLVAIVGPSGAGKDSVINTARVLLGDCTNIQFARRSVTRKPDLTEDSDHVDVDTFDRMAQSGAFVLQWEAHGLLYGVPCCVDETVQRGGVVVVNISRSIIGDVRARYRRTCVIFIDAPLELRSARLAARSRESAPDIARRLARAAPMERANVDFIIDNSGALLVSATELAAIIRDQLSQTP